MTHRKILLYIDLLACFVFIPLVIMLLPMERWLAHRASSVGILLAFVYLLYFAYRFIHLPQLFMKKKYFVAIAAIVVLLATTTMLSYMPLDSDVSGLTERQIANRQGYRRQIIWFLFLIVSGFSISIELALELFRQIVSKQEIELHKEKAELMLYKSQINPHFLFNTLNTLYALVISGSEKTESAFIKFSNILRYTYSKTDDDMITIGQEMEYISQYVDLQKLRLNQHTDVKLTADIDDESALIPPMILITFIENAFKYGTSSEKDCVIKISITLKNSILEFYTENSIMRHKERNVESVGIENCCKRLNLIYGDSYNLDVSDKDGIYRSLLTIHLK